MLKTWYLFQIISSERLGVAVKLQKFIDKRNRVYNNSRIEGSFLA